MGSGLGYGTAYYTVFVFESSGSAKYAVVQVPLRFRFDREVLVFSQAAPLPEVGGGGGKENKRQDLITCYYLLAFFLDLVDLLVFLVLDFLLFL